MAKFLQLCSIFFLFFFIIATNGEDEEFVRTQNNTHKEKITRMHFYLHDTYTGKNPPSVLIVPPASNTSKTFFGGIIMFDDALTLGPKASSKLVGKAQGLYGFASQQHFELLMAMNFVFIDGKYNGSTITVLGRNAVSYTGEMPILGGTGIFRFGRGYVRTRTYSANAETGDAIFEYNVYVWHHY